jgi:hypothetical protein
LDDELSAVNTTVAAFPCKDHVAKLLNSSQLVESRLLKELHDNLVDQLALEIIFGILACLKVGNEAIVLVILVFQGLLQPEPSSIREGDGANVRKSFFGHRDTFGAASEQGISPLLCYGKCCFFAQVAQKEPYAAA